MKSNLPYWPVIWQHYPPQLILTCMYLHIWSWHIYKNNLKYRSFIGCYACFCVLTQSNFFWPCLPSIFSRRILRSRIVVRWEGFRKGPYWVTHSWAEPEHVWGAKSPQRRVEDHIFVSGLWQRNCEALMSSRVSSGRCRMFFGTLLLLQNVSVRGPLWGESAALCWCWQLLKYVWAEDFRRLLIWTEWPVTTPLDLH